MITNPDGTFEPEEEDFPTDWRCVHSIAPGIFCRFAHDQGKLVYQMWDYKSRTWITVPKTEPVVKQQP